MVYFIVTWIAGSLGLFLIANVAPGFRVMDLDSALAAAGVVALLSAALGTIFRYVDNLLSLALWAVFLLIVDVFLFRLAGLVVPGFTMRGFEPAFVGAGLLLGLSLGLLILLRGRSEDVDKRW